VTQLGTTCRYLLNYHYYKGILLQTRTSATATTLTTGQLLAHLPQESLGLANSRERIISVFIECFY